MVDEQTAHWPEHWPAKTAEERTARIDNEIAALVTEKLLTVQGCVRLVEALYDPERKVYARLRGPVPEGEGIGQAYVRHLGVAEEEDARDQPSPIQQEAATRHAEIALVEQRLLGEIGKVRTLAMEAAGAGVVDGARLGEVQTRLESLIQSVARHEVEARRRLQAYVDRRMEHDEQVYSGRWDDYKKTYVTPMEERIAKLEDTVATLNLQREHGEPFNLPQRLESHETTIQRLNATVTKLEAAIAPKATPAPVSRDLADRVTHAPKGALGETGARLRLSLADVGVEGPAEIARAAAVSPKVAAEVQQQAEDAWKAAGEAAQADPKGEIPNAEAGLLTAKYLRTLRDRMARIPRYEDPITLSRHDLETLIYEITYWRKKAAVANAVAKTQNDLADVSRLTPRG